MLYPFLSKRELEVMAFDHKYQSTGASMIDRLFLKAWATWCSERLPLKHNPKAWLHLTAPNSLTLIGLMCMVIPSTVILATSADLKSPSPPWAYLATAAGIFCYQTLDELDGKQARRTGSSTSLGELFDHGLDAISTFFTVSACLCVCQTDFTVGAFAAFVAANAAFQGAHIQTYYKGMLFFGIVDVAEAQWSGIIMNLVCGLYDPNFFSNGEIFGIPYRIIPMIFVIVGGSQSLVRNLYVTIVATKDSVKHASTPPLEMWAQWVLMWGLAIAWFFKAQDQFVGWDRIIFLCSLGFMNSSQTITIIVAHMARTRVPYVFNLVRLVPLALAVANADLEILPNSQVVLMVFCLSAVHFLHYGCSLAAQMADFLGVSVFKVGGQTCVDTRV